MVSKKISTKKILKQIEEIQDIYKKLEKKEKQAENGKSKKKKSKSIDKVVKIKSGKSPARKSKKRIKKEKLAKPVKTEVATENDELTSEPTPIPSSTTYNAKEAMRKISTLGSIEELDDFLEGEIRRTVLERAASRRRAIYLEQDS